MERIVIIDSQTIVRIGFVSLFLEQLPGSQIIECFSLDEGLPYLTRDIADLIILDLKPKEIKRLAAFTKGNRGTKKPRFLIYSAMDEEKYALQCLQWGAEGFLPKEATRTEHLNAIRAIICGQRYVSPKIQQQLFAQIVSEPSLATPGKNEKLSELESDVARLLMKGMAVSKIAECLSTDIAAIKSIKNSIFAKTGAGKTLEQVQQLNQHRQESC